MNKDEELIKAVSEAIRLAAQIQRDIEDIEREILSEVEGKPTEFAAWSTVANTKRWASRLQAEWSELYRNMTKQ